MGVGRALRRRLGLRASAVCRGDERGRETLQGRLECLGVTDGAGGLDGEECLI